MADNTTVTPGTGKTVLADEVVDGVLGTGIVQMVKIMDGTLDGTAKAVVDANGLRVNAPPSATATLTNVAASTTSVTVLAANTARLGLVIVNDSTVNLFIKFGATASATSFTYKLIPGATLEYPQGAIVYTGRIDGIWDAASGTARVTELVA